MSNVALFNNQLPDYLKEVQLDDVTRALAGDSQVKRIALGNNKFVLKVNGTEVSKTNTDKLEVVIVNASKHISRTYYAKEWDPKNTTVTPPDCWSNDGEKPDPSVKEPQSATCMGCPQDINGSGQGNTKACRKNRRIAVALASDLDGDVYQMTLQSKSIFYDMKDPGDLDHMPFNQYAKYVGSQGYNLNTLVTEMRFDEDSNVGKLFFRPVRFLERHEWEQAKKLGETPAAKNAVTMTIAQADSAKPKLEAPKAKAEVAKVEVEAEQVSEPKKREEKKVEPTPKRDLKAVMSGWSTDDAA